MRKLIYLLIFQIIIVFPAVAQQSVGNARIDKVYLIFKTHLDVGFTELGSKVVDTYNHEFIPAALKLSETFAANDTLKNHYPWTTGSWLIWNYLQSAGESERQRMIAAIERKDFFWHAMPFTLQTELCDSSFLSVALAISEQLDRQFNRKTRAAKITDVPGVTRSVIPVFKRHGISLLHIGANPGAAVPQLPEVFRWHDSAGEEINVIYQSDYGKPLIIPGTNTAVIINFTHDNHGPHTYQQIEDIYAAIRRDYPNAAIIGASLNEVADEVDRVAGQLPLITDEIGDTWMYGIASEPRMIAELRQLLRLRNQWIKDNKLVPQSQVDIRFCIPLLLIAEHTWGLDVKTFLRNFDIYEFDKYSAFTQSAAYQYIERSWDEKREKILEAVAVLPTELQREAMETLLLLAPEKPDVENFTIVKSYKQVFDTDYFQVSFDEKSGSVNFLKDKITKLIWSDANHLWGEFTYQNYTGDDFKKFIAQYCPPQPEWWMLDDYGKPGLDKISVQGGLMNYELVQTLYKKEKKGTTIWLEMQPSWKENAFGSPQTVYIKYFFPVDNKQIEIEVNWFDKQKNRVPEAAWFSLIPAPLNTGLSVDKMNCRMDICHTVDNGARRIHGINGGIYYESDSELLTVEAMDSPLVVFNNRNLIDFDNEIAKPEKGLHFNLLNTLWGTNYPQWFGGDMKYRFIIEFKSVCR